MPYGAESREPRVPGRPVRRAIAIIQEREDSGWARVGKMGVVRKC